MIICHVIYQVVYICIISVLIKRIYYSQSGWQINSPIEIAALLVLCITYYAQYEIVFILIRVINRTIKPVHNIPPIYKPSTKINTISSNPGHL